MRDWADPIPEDKPKKLDELVDELDEVNEELAEGPGAAARGAERRESEERIAERRRRGPDLESNL